MVSKVLALGIALVVFGFFSACENPVLQSGDAEFEARKVGTGSAGIGNVSINGTIESPFSQSVVITLTDNSFVVSEEDDVTSWFTNPPLGIFSAEVASISGGSDNIATITVSGTSSVVSSFWIHVTIPEDALLFDDAPIAIIPTANAFYNIRWDHTAWTQSAAAPFTDGSVNASAYGEGTYVVGNRNNGKAAYSTDGGKSWTQTDVRFGENHISSLAYINGTFYATGFGGNLSSSLDGITWTPLGSGLLNNADIKTIAYGNGITLIAGTNGQAAYIQGYPSLGAAWKSINGFPNFSANFNSIAYGLDTAGNPLFVISGQEALTGYSNDGINWTDTTYQTNKIFPPTGSQSSIKMVAYDPNNRKFVVVGFHEAAYVVPAPGNFTWVGVNLEEIMGTTARTSWLNAVTYGGGYFVAGGSGGQAISSTDGVSWAITGVQGQFPPASDIQFINSIAYNEDGIFDQYLIAGGVDAGPAIAAYNLD
jgi:hypothetical protein